jgi:hypothetical protein
MISFYQLIVAVAGCCCRYYYYHHHHHHHFLSQVFFIIIMRCVDEKHACLGDPSAPELFMTLYEIRN